MNSAKLPGQHDLVSDHCLWKAGNQNGILFIQATANQMEMSPSSGRKLALFLSFVLLIAGLMTAVPDTWLLGNPSCHSCHDAQ
jgi:hypothetical protein